MALGWPLLFVFFKGASSSKVLKKTSKGLKSFYTTDVSEKILEQEPSTEEPIVISLETPKAPRNLVDNDMISIETKLKGEVRQKIVF